MGGATLLLLLSGNSPDPGMELLLQTIIIPGPGVTDGIRVEAAVVPWRMIAANMKSDPNFLRQVPPRRLEELIAASYDEAGFDEVILTPASGDEGRDVIATKRGFVNVRVLDQVKRYKPGHVVTAEEVRALIGVLAADQNATNGVVTTTSDFAPRIKEDRSIKPFLPDRLNLINGAELADRFLGLSRPDAQ